MNYIDSSMLVLGTTALVVIAITLNEIKNELVKLVKIQKANLSAEVRNSLELDDEIEEE